MRCSATHCSSQGISETARCVTCSKRVHHLCSNDVVAKFKGLLDDAPVAASTICGSKFVGVEYVSDGPDSDDAGTLSSGDGDDPGVKKARPPRFQSHQTLTEEAEYDKHGIPFSVIHGPPPGGRSDGWSVIHFLEKPIHIAIGKKAETFTTVCLECAKDECEHYGAAESWKKGLCNNLNASNAKEQLRRAHEDHPIVKVVHDQKLARGKTRIQEAQRQLSQTLAKRQKSSLDEGKPSVAVQSGDLKSFWGSTDVRNTNTEMSSWLTNDGVLCACFRDANYLLTDRRIPNIVPGLPYNVVQSRHLTAFQERVFSSGGIVMSKLRTRTENRRAEKQLLMKHNSREIELMNHGIVPRAHNSEG
ncbi:hypothetical protein DVH05_023453 [Phytophthora capsici]|nr:hypothetical protein DVH05_023453 [Phytophthora capsici]